MIVHENNLAAITLIFNKSYEPDLPRINMFVNISIKLGKLVDEAPFPKAVFSSPPQNFPKEANIHFLKANQQ